MINNKHLIRSLALNASYNAQTRAQTNYVNTEPGKAHSPFRFTNANFLTHIEMLNTKYAIHYHILAVPGAR
jgi:hypothetical protein